MISRNVNKHASNSYVGNPVMYDFSSRFLELIFELQMLKRHRVTQVTRSSKVQWTGSRLNEMNFTEGTAIESLFDICNVVEKGLYQRKYIACIPTESRKSL